jgi:ribonuclease P protein component
MMHKLSKQVRLRKSKKFQFVYTTGKSYANKLAVLYVMPNEQNLLHVGFAAGKRLGCAVVRNRVKRLLREAYRLNQDKVTQGYDLILVGRQPIVKTGLADVEKAFLDLCKRARILNA